LDSLNNIISRVDELVVLGESFRERLEYIATKNKNRCTRGEYAKSDLIALESLFEVFKRITKL